MARHDAALAEQAEFDARQQKQHDLDRSLAATHRQLEKTRKDVAGLPLQLESASAVNRRLARLADLAGETGVVLDEVQPSPAVDGASLYQTVPIRIAGSGSYPACAMFLHRLRDRFPDTAVKSFDCSNPGRSATTPPRSSRPRLGLVHDADEEVDDSGPSRDTGFQPVLWAQE